MCGGCHAVVGGVDPASVRTSRKAIASFVLGCASVVGLFVTAIPALLLGAAAIRGIRREPDTLKGTGWAVAGITTGGLFGLACSACVVSSVLFAVLGRRSMVDTDDPRQIAEIARKVGTCEVPAGLQPLKAEEFGLVDARCVVYGRNPRSAAPIIVLLQQMQGTLPFQADQMLRQTLNGEDGRNGPFTIVGTEQVTYTIRGQTVVVVKLTGVDEWSGSQYRQYTAAIPDPDRITNVAVITPDEAGVTIELGPPTGVAPPGTPREQHITTALSDDEVRRFFESFQ
jgi:hypothetical protein